MNDLDFTPVERQILERSSDSEMMRRRRATVIGTGVAFAALIVVTSATAPSSVMVPAVTLVYIAITIWEKVAYANAVLAYKSLIRKLRGRIEELEGDRMPGADAG